MIPQSRVVLLPCAAFAGRRHIRGMLMTIGFVGLGLIGGSIAKAVRRVHPDIRLIAWNRTASVLVEAMRDGIIDQQCFEITSSFRECDIIFLCVPVISMRDILTELTGYLKKDAIITDVGSTKCDIHHLASELGLDRHFIGGHPMAGSEKSGYRNSHDRLIENAWYVLTPGSEIPISTLSSFSEFISSLGALPLILTPEEHDYTVAAVSHVPHVISASLVNMVRDLDGPGEYMKTIAAGGFKDITRISSSSPQMWQEICLTNADNICTVLDRYIRSLTDFRFAIRNENGEKLLQYFTECRDYRDNLTDDSSGPIRKNFRLYSDIADETGAIANVAAILADGGISIKNIGIVHNREFEQGVLRIDFYDDLSSKNAARLLESRDYHIYEV